MGNKIQQVCHRCGNAHHNRTQQMEFGSCGRLGEAVGDHFISGTELNCQVSSLDLVCNKEVSHVDVSGPLGRACFSVLFQQNSTPVVLMNNISIHLETLCLEEQSDPEHRSHAVINSHQFSFC